MTAPLWVCILLAAGLFSAGMTYGALRMVRVGREAVARERRRATIGQAYVEHDGRRVLRAVPGNSPLALWLRQQPERLVVANRVHRDVACGGELSRVLPQVRDIRRFGSAAIDLCHVAEGVVDVYYERGLNPWDLAAGGLIAREAGVRVGGLRGRPADVDLVVATPPALWEPLTTLLDGEPRADSD